MVYFTKFICLHRINCYLIDVLWFQAYITNFNQYLGSSYCECSVHELFVLAYKVIRYLLDIVFSLFILLFLNQGPIQPDSLAGHRLVILGPKYRPLFLAGAHLLAKHLINYWPVVAFIWAHMILFKSTRRTLKFS